MIANRNLTIKKPSPVPMPEAGGLGIVFVTAYHTLVKLGRIQKGDTVLIHSATGGVGQAAVMIAQHFGANIIATAGSAAKREFLKSTYGIQYVSDSHSLGWADDVMKWTNGKGVTMILNSLAGDAITKGISVLAPGGRFLEIGKRDILGNSPLGLRDFLLNKAFFSAQLDLMMEHSPEHFKELFEEVGQLFESGALKPVPTQVYSVDRLTEVSRLVAGGKHQGKIVIQVPADYIPPELEPATLEFDPKASYVITGGFGGVGLAFAEWLGSRGAKHVVLVGRRGVVNSRGKRTIKKLNDKGVEVSSVKADVSTFEDCQKIFAPEVLKGRPVKGIVHLAMVLEDNLLNRLTKEKFRAVLLPKAFGGVHLHELTKDQEPGLDFFIMSSSICDLGNWEQANYAAANLAMDPLAFKRKQAGLPALAIQFGAIRGAGFLDFNRLAAKITKMRGFNTLHITELLFMIERMVRHNDAGVVCLADENWAAIKENARDHLKYSHLVLENVQSDTKSTANMSKEEMIEVAVKQLSEVLGLPASRIDITEPVVSYGVDSLMSVELVNWVKRQFNITVSQMDILSGMSIQDIINRLDFQGSGGDAAAAAMPAAGAAPAKAHKHSESQAPLVQIREARAAKSIVVLFPYMGATADKVFKNWDMFLDESDLYTVQARPESLNALIPQLVPAIFNATKAKPGVPLYFYGHSMGAIVAYQVAQHIHRLPVDEQPPLCGLMVGAAPAPTTKLLRGLEEWSPESIKELPDERLIKSQKDIGIVPMDAEATPELAAILRKDMMLLKTFTLFPGDEPLTNNKTILPYPVHGFVGKMDKMVKREEVQEWSHFTKDFALTAVDGGHTFLEQNINAFTALLQGFVYKPSSEWNPKPMPTATPATAMPATTPMEMPVTMMPMMNGHHKENGVEPKKKMTTASAEPSSMVPVTTTPPPQGSSFERITPTTTTTYAPPTTPAIAPTQQMQQAGGLPWMTIGVMAMGLLMGAFYYS